ncbi:MAG: MotA/TolQ/ExbB proton channel family protein [Candidatus Eutrophobiaceae bacterium]
MNSYNKPEHFLLLSWLILTGLILACLAISWHYGIIQLLFTVDKSRISWCIALTYLLVTIHCLVRVLYISTQHNLAQTVFSLFQRELHVALESNSKGMLVLNKIPLPECVLTKYLQDCCASDIKRGNDEKIGGEQVESSLVEVYESHLKSPQDIGWFVSDMMLKLGLLGTIIGFIFMLGSVANVADFDITAIQNILRHMSSGMGTALYTTLVGLICSVLASLQYQMLDKHCDEIVIMARHLLHAHIVPKKIAP